MTIKMRRRLIWLRNGYPVWICNGVTIALVIAWAWSVAFFVVVPLAERAMLNGW